MWDADAKKLALKVIGTVESGLRYDAVNRSDPITVGAFQWYGSRAAGLLQRIGAEDPGSLDDVPASLTDDLTEYMVYQPGAVPVKILYGNMIAHVMDGGDGYTAFTSRVDDAVALVLSTGCDIFLATELSSVTTGPYFLDHLKAVDSDWAISYGEAFNACLYRPSMYTMEGKRLWALPPGYNKYCCDWHLTQDATGYDFHAMLTHLTPGEDEDAERLTQAKYIASKVASIGRCVLAGDFNEWELASDTVKGVLKNRAGLIRLQDATNPVNADRNSLSGSTNGHWIDDILTRTSQVLTNGALVPTNGTSDHWGWVKVTVDFDGSKPASQTSNSFWSTRYLSSDEVAALKPVLMSHQPIQNTQALEDLNAYVDIAVQHGIDMDDNTDAMIFFMCMYHQSPKQALAVLAIAGSDSSVNRLYTYAMRNAVLSHYNNRYTTARNLITAHDISGIDLTGSVGEPNTDEDTGGDPSDGTGAALNYIMAVGNNLHLVYADGSRQVASATPGEYWQVSGSSEVDDTTTIPSDPGDENLSRGQRVLAWMTAHIGLWKYSQDAGRLNPEKSGFTDCSGVIWRCYKEVLGIDVGTWTGAQYRQGRLITTDRAKVASGEGLEPGDLIFYHAYKSATHRFNHVEMYVDSTHTIGQVGSDDPGPNLHPTHRYLDWAKLDVMVRRYV